MGRTVPRQIQKAWWREHQHWWFDSPEAMDVGDVGTVDDGVWHVYTKARPSLAATEAVHSESGPVIRYTNVVANPRLDAGIEVPSVLVLAAGGPPVGGSGRLGRSRKSEAGEAISAKATRSSTPRNWHGLVDSIRSAVRSPDWDASLLVVTWTEVATTEQRRARLSDSQTRVEWALSAADVLEVMEGTVEGAHATGTKSGRDAVYPAGRPIQVDLHGVNKKFWRWKRVGSARPGGRWWGLQAVWIVSPEEMDRMIAEGEPLLVPYTWHDHVENQRAQRRAQMEAAGSAILLTVGAVWGATRSASKSRIGHR